MDEGLIYLSNIKRTVLVVDDEEINREILGTILEDSYEVAFAANGEEAMDVIREKGPLLSLVLLDIMMPIKDGYAVIEEMQQDVIMRNIPIIVLTSDVTAEVESLKRGAVDFIKKPYDMPEKILARVKRIIALFEDRMIIQSTERDELTGLLSKSFFYEYATMQDRFYPGRKMDAVVTNINHFHLFNELYGMQEGDRLLFTVAETIKKYAEKKDGIAGRSENDIFYLYIPHKDSYEDILEDVKRAIIDDYMIHNAQIRIGVNDSIEEDTGIEMAFERARMAGNTIRDDYSRNIAYYDDKMRKQRVFEERLIQDIADGLARKQFIVLYQPKYDIQGDEPVLKGAEALVRWNHPEFGMVYPGSFISLFEENGLIQLVDEYVCRAAAKQVKKWKDEFGVTIPISVNISRIDIMDDEIVDTISDIVSAAEIDNSELHLEITESAYSADTHQLVEKVIEFRKRGFVIEMDDFGSGYSSLNMLTTLPIDILKVDMKFIHGVHEDEKNTRMMELIMDIADFIKVPVVAEGVEKEQQYHILKDLGCEMIQGFYFSEPVVAAEFEELIKK